ncbi:MAG: recombination mediator RecR [Chthoniobacterales bacterium]|nr:recombination mediator RecR [Chthoniobacterales bacterium]
MSHLDYPESFRELVRQFRRLPGIGPRSAERIALWMMRSPDAKSEQLIAAVSKARESLKTCRLCGFFAESDECSLCLDEARAGRELCVVETATDILPLERTGVFRGRYHALGGKLSPLDGIGPEQLRIGELLERIGDERPSEVILALGVDVEGEATSHYLAEMIAPTGVHVTRIAQGLPAGGGVDQADQITLHRALANRGAYGSNGSNKSFP